MAASSVHKLFSLVVLLSLVCQPLAQASRQGDKETSRQVDKETSSQGIAAPETGLYRTTVTVDSPSRRARLEALGVVVLTEDTPTPTLPLPGGGSKGGGRLVVLADADQLEALARLRFEPRATDDADALVAAHAREKPWLAAAWAEVRTAASLVSLSTSSLSTFASLDDDADGLTNTEEAWWCTDPLNPNSDGDAQGYTDGQEVAALLDFTLPRSVRWGYGPPFGPPNAWPNFNDRNGTHVNVCNDGDYDTIPDYAEVYMVGTRVPEESTDRDKFDDGQELFGITYCPGAPTNCGYGSYPAVEYWNFVQASMPNWVLPPGDNPLVAAFPVPEVYVTPGSWRVERVTTITTSEGQMAQKEHSYETSVTRGESSSIADTVNWNNWEEVSKAIETPLGQQAQANASVVSVSPTFSTKDFVFGAGKVLGGVLVGGVGLVGGALCETIVGCVVAAVAVPAGAELVKSGFIDAVDAFKPNDAQQQQGTNKYNITNVNNVSASATANASVVLNQNFDFQGVVNSLDGVQYAINQQGELLSRGLQDISYQLSRPRYTETRTNGHSWGGAQTTTHEVYEEHSISEGEAFTTGKNWSTAWAVDSSHAADLTFEFAVKNTGTEYARELSGIVVNVYIGDDTSPAISYPAWEKFPDGKLENLFPVGPNTPAGQFSTRTFTTNPIALSLEQMKRIDLGERLTVKVESYSFGADELFYTNAVTGGVTVYVEDGVEDGDETVDSYVIPTWGVETVQDVLTRYFRCPPGQTCTDADGNLNALWTPEFDGINPPAWHEHYLSDIAWWNVYLTQADAGDTPLKDLPAQAGSGILFRFNRDSDRDGYNDRAEFRYYCGLPESDPLRRPNGSSGPDYCADAHLRPEIHPQPEVSAGYVAERSGNVVTAKLAVQNTGTFDAYGIDAVMYSPDDTTTVGNNTVGGNGRVRPGNHVAVGSLIKEPDKTNWGASTSKPYAGGQFSGAADRTFTFTAETPGVVGQDGTSVRWSDGMGGGAVIPLGGSYHAPLPVDVAHGVQVGFNTGTIAAGARFTVEALTPRDTFTYTVNSDPYTAPVIVVSYSDPQGSHRFVTPVELPSLDTSIAAGQMLEGLKLDIVTPAAFDAAGANTTNLVVNSPHTATIQAGHLYLNFVSDGKLVLEKSYTLDIPTGPTVFPAAWSVAEFSADYHPDGDNLLIAFWTDSEGNIIDSAARPLNSFAEDPKPAFAMATADETWDFGTAQQGTLMQRTFTLASVGYMDLLTHLSTITGATVAGPTSHSLPPGDTATYTVTLNTQSLPVGAFAQEIQVRTSDPEHPEKTITIRGDVTEMSPEPPPSTPTPTPTPTVTPTPTPTSTPAPPTFAWSTANLSEGRQQLAAASVGNKVLFAGGFNYRDPGGQKATVDIYDASTETWSTATLSVPREVLAATSVGSKALFGGGWSFLGCSAVVDLYDDFTNTWSTASLSQARGNLVATSVGGRAFFAGGGCNSESYAVMDIYDSMTGTWSTATLPRVRYGWAVTSVGDKVIFAGGQDAYGPSSTVDIYDSASSTWSTAALSVPRDHLAATSVGGKAIFAGGGVGPYSDANPTTRVDIYDAATNTWSTADLSFPRLDLAATSVDGVAFFAGGGNYNTCAWGSSRVDMYDVTTGMWSTAELSVPRLMLAATSVAEKALFAGGYQNCNYTNAEARVDIAEVVSNASSPVFTVALTPSTTVGNYAAGALSVTKASACAADPPQWIASIPVGMDPSGVAVNSITNRAYVANSGDGSVSVVDLIHSAVFSTISVGRLPTAVSVNSSTNRIYVANQGSNTVSVIDGSTNTVVATIPVWGSPRGIGVNPLTNRIYVSNYADNRVAVIDGTANSIVSVIAVSSPSGVGVDPDANRVYVANHGETFLSVVDGTTDSVIRTITVRTGPEGVAVNPGSRRVYVANHDSGILSVIDGVTNSVIASVDVGAGPAGVDVNPNSERVFVGSDQGGSDQGVSISVVDETSGTVIATMNLRDPVPALAVNTRTNRIYAANTRIDSLMVIQDFPCLRPSTLRYIRLPARSHSQVVVGIRYGEDFTPAGPLAFTVDVGADGTVDWSQASSTVTYPVMFSSPNLAAAFNAYLAGRSGEVDVPIRIAPNPLLDTALTGFSATPVGQPDASIGAGDVAFGGAVAAGDSKSLQPLRSLPSQADFAPVAAVSNRPLTGDSKSLQQLRSLPSQADFAPVAAVSNRPDTDPTEGDTITVNATIHTPGALDTGPLTVAFYAIRTTPYADYIGSAFIPSVPPSSASSASVSWNTLGFTGEVPVRVIVDPYNRVAESNENNNVVTATVNIRTRPDLSIPAIALSDPEPTAGETVTVTLAVSNTGQTATPAFAISFADDNTQSLIPNTQLPAASSAAVSFSWTPSTPGLHRLFARADRDGQVNESDEGNNDRWSDVYVGFDAPVALDSGAITQDRPYTTVLGYGAVDTGLADAIVTCAGRADPTLRRDPSNRVGYRFDHLQPGRFYHLDIVLYECDNNQRVERVLVNDLQVAGPVALGDQAEHRLSIRLDPAAYREHVINIAVLGEEGSQRGAVVASVTLREVDYRYSDSGSPNDPAYTVGRGWGYLDANSVAITGTLPYLPYRSARVDQDDAELRYRFDRLDPAKRYQVSLTFWQATGNPLLQRVRADGLDTSATVNLVAGAPLSATVRLSPAAYATDGSVVVSVVVLNAGAGATVNEISLEEETLLTESPCHVQETPNLSHALGGVIVNGIPAPIGTVVTAESPRGEVVGCYVVGSDDSPAGQYGFMPIYGEDATATPPIPGMREGELVTFRVDGALGQATPPFYWHNDPAEHWTDLVAMPLQGQSILLPQTWNLLSFRVEPPVPLVGAALGSIAGKYDRVLGETGIYDTGVPPQFQTLTELHAGRGYYLRLTVPSVNLLIEGSSLAGATPLPLRQGWNWVGYLPQSTLPITTALASIAGAYQRVLSIGQYYDTRYPPSFSTLKQLSPGQGYLLYATRDVTLTYPAALAASDATVIARSVLSGDRCCLAGGVEGCSEAIPGNEKDCFAKTARNDDDVCRVAATPDLTIIYGALTVAGAPAPVGARVEALTPAGEVAGCAVVDTPGQYGFMFLYGADAAATPSIPGFRAGEPVRLRVNGQVAALPETIVWQGDRAPHRLDLAVGGWKTWLPAVGK